MSLLLFHHQPSRPTVFHLCSLLRESHLHCCIQQVSMGTGTKEIVSYNQSSSGERGLRYPRKAQNSAG